MTKRSLMAAALLAFASGVFLPAQSSRTAEAQFKAAQHKEQVEGDLKGAIEQYKKIAQSGDRALAARALVAIGQCYEKLGQSDARNTYERVVREFADQSESVEQARARLAALALPATHAEAARQVWLARAGDDMSESLPSPDGRYIGFTEWETGDLAVRDLTTGTSWRLTNTGGWEASGDWAEGSVISPDSRQIAFFWASPEKDRRNEVRVMPINGGTPRTVYRTHDSHEWITLCGWSPDSKQLLVIRDLPDNTRQLAMLSLQDGSIRAVKTLAPPSHAALFPDGRYIAYDSQPAGSSHDMNIFVLATDGSGETAVVEGSGLNRYPMWSPDGSRILFLSDRTGTPSLWAMPVRNGKATGPAQLIKADLGRIFPLGITRAGILYYVLPRSNRSNIYTADLGADMKIAKEPVLATEKFVNSNMWPSLSHDGQYLAFFSVRRGPSPVLVIQNLKTKEERDLPLPLPSVPLFGVGPIWFPDDRSVLAVSRELQVPGFGFYRVDVTSGKTEKMLNRVSLGEFQGLTLSPDGKTIFYTQGGNSLADPVSLRLIRFDIESRHEKELKSGEWFISPTISPDGRQLAYLVSVRPGSASYLAIMPANGGEEREVFRGSPWMDPSRYGTLAWTPDQRYLLFVRGGVGDSTPNVLWRVSVSGGQPEQMGLSIAGRIKSPQVTPDGKRIFFGATESGPNELWALENFLPK